LKQCVGATEPCLRSESCSHQQGRILATSPTSRVSPNNANRVKLLPVSVIAPTAPTTASGRDISIARQGDRAEQQHHQHIHEHQGVPSALKMSLNALKPVVPTGVGDNVPRRQRDVPTFAWTAVCTVPTTCRPQRTR